MTRPTKARTTLKAIAQEAGVTTTTVSCILNNKGGRYAEQTKQRVLEIAQRRKYRPNVMAQGVKTGQSNTAGIMIPNRELFYTEIINAIHDTLLKNETLLLLCWNDYYWNNARDDQKERRIIHHLVDRQVDGIILCPTTEDFEHSYFEEIWQKDIPLILIDRELSKFNTDFVGSDDEKGGAIVAEHLLSLGHRKLLYLGANNLSTSKHRESGFRKATKDRCDVHLQAIDSEAPDCDEQLLQRLQSKDHRPTAVFCINDHVALRRLLPITEAAGLRVPEDLSIVGYGNQRLDRGREPFLTTVDQHPDKIGSTAAQLYLQRMHQASPAERRKELIRPTLMVHQSTTPLP